MVIRRLHGSIVETTLNNKNVFFFVHNPEDYLQKQHMEGHFFELEELQMMAKYLSPGARYLDIGANVGNHILYFCHALSLECAVAIEPNPLARAILEINVRLNNIHQRVDLSLLGYGLSDAAGKANIVVPKGNLGGAKCVPDNAGKFTLTTGDELLGLKNFDFIKIDIEGMEIKCLHGMNKLIARCQPTICVEVDNTNLEDFTIWCQQQNYHICDEYRRYTQNTNYVVMPISA